MDILGNDSIDFDNFPAPNLRSSILPGFKPNSTADLLNDSPGDLSIYPVYYLAGLVLFSILNFLNPDFNLVFNGLFFNPKNNIQCVNPGSTKTWAPRFWWGPEFERGESEGPTHFCDQSQAWGYFASYASVQQSIVLPVCDWSDWIAHFGPCETPQNASKLWPADPTYLFLELGFTHYSSPPTWNLTLSCWQLFDPQYLENKATPLALPFVDRFLALWKCTKTRGGLRLLLSLRLFLYPFHWDSNTAIIVITLWGSYV